jgi:uncharacterized membrane protein YkvA (DUF1232 family)
MTSQKPVVANAGKNMSFLTTMIKQVRLAWLLLQDKRVPIWVKSVIPLALLYVVSPFDLIPIIPVVGQLDDLGVILLGLTTFIKLCPSDVVQYYRLQLDDYFDQEENEAVVDATYRRLDKE